MIEKNATIQQQQCINHCSQSDGKELCRTCPFINDNTGLVEAGQARDAKTQVVLDGLDKSIEKSKELTNTDLDVSANRADISLFCGIALALVVGVLLMIGGVL